MRRIVFFVLLFAAGASICQAQEESIRRAERYEPEIIRAAVKYRVDPRVLWTVAWLETRFRHYDERGRIITSRAGAKGIMQFMPKTADRYGWRDEHDTVQAIDAAARYLKNLQAIFAGRLDQILAAYNSGEAAVEAYRTGRTLVLSSGKVINPKGIRSDIPPYRETVGYVRNGLAVFRKLAAAKYFSAPHLTRLQIIETPEEEPAALITVDLEEMPEELQKGSVYAVEETPSTVHKPPREPNLPRNSKTQSVYSH